MALNILFFSSYYPPFTRGGAEISTHYLAQALIKRGHKVTVITHGPKHEKVAIEGVDVLRVPLPFTSKPLFERRHSQKMAKQLAGYIENVQHHDIAHAHDFRMAQIIAEMALPRRVVTARDYAQICGTTNAIDAVGNLNPARTLSSAWQSHRIQEASLWRKPFRLWQYVYNIEYRGHSFLQFPHQIFISHAQRKYIAKFQDLSAVTTHVVFNPISEAFLFTTPQAAALNQELLYVGTLESYKGVDLLLQAFHELGREFPSAQLTLVGTGAHQATYEQQILQQGLQYKVRFAGQVPYEKLLQYYDRSEIVVAPHVWIEPFGRTVAEAMARRKIVVSANIGGPSEMIQDKINGLLFERGSVASLKAALRQALTLRGYQKKDMQNGAYSWVRANLQQSVIAEQHEQIYTTIAAR